MNKNLIIGIVVVVLLLLGGSYFLMKGKTVKNSTTLPVVDEQKQGSPQTLKDIIGLGIPQKCTFDKGQMYIAEGKVRGDFDGNSHMIVSENTSYIWTDGQATGFKTTFDLAKTSDVNPVVDSEQQSGFDYSESQNYNCVAWAVDPSIFEFPTDVEFQDMSKFVDPPKPEADSSESQCSYCDALTGDPKAQCLTSLNCN